MAGWFWYAVIAAVLYGAHQIFTRVAADHIGEGLGGFVVEATAALSILGYLVFLWLASRWNQQSSAQGIFYSLLTGICVGAGTIAFFLVSKRRSALFGSSYPCRRRGNQGHRWLRVFPRSAIMAANRWRCVCHHGLVFTAQIVSEAAKLRGLREIPRIVSVGVMMCEPFFDLIFRYLFLLEGRRLDVNCGDRCCCRIHPHVCKVFLARLRNVDRPDQHSVFFFKLSALDRPILNSSQRNSFSLMLCYAGLSSSAPLCCAHKLEAGQLIASANAMIDPLLGFTRTLTDG